MIRTSTALLGRHVRLAHSSAVLDAARGALGLHAEALLLFQRGQGPSAAQALERALTMNPDCSKAASTLVGYGASWMELKPPLRHCHCVHAVGSSSHQSTQQFVRKCMCSTDSLLHPSLSFAMCPV